MLGELISAGANLLGGLFGRSSAEAAAEKNAALQREFAQNSIRWKVEDAKAAGISPLAALGASGYSASPSYVGDTSLSQGLANAGQDVGRAIDATRTVNERVGAYEKTVQDLSLTRMGLENELLASQIAKVRQAGHPPAMPGDGPNLTDLKMFGEDVKAHPGWSDASDVQNRWGEPAEWAYFPFVAGADALRWLKDKYGIEFVRGQDPWRGAPRPRTGGGF